MGLGGREGAVAPELVRMFLSVPLDKLRSFGLGITTETVAALVAEAHENRRRLLADGTYLEG